MTFNKSNMEIILNKELKMTIKIGLSNNTKLVLDTTCIKGLSDKEIGLKFLNMSMKLIKLTFLNTLIHQSDKVFLKKMNH